MRSLKIRHIKNAMVQTVEGHGVFISYVLKFCTLVYRTPHSNSGFLFFL